MTGFNMKQRTIIFKFSGGVIFIMIAVLGLMVCSENVKPPTSMRLDLAVIVKDTTGFTEALTGGTVVPEAKVFINSLSYFNFHEQSSDSNGTAAFNQVLPDVYNISVTKRLSAEAVEQVTGSPNERVLNGQLQNIEVTAADTVTLYVQISALGTILFSEIYYNGSEPSPIPFYFHDQFTEIYNNSQDTIYLDSMIIADADFGYIDDDYIHSIHAYMFPGTGQDYPLYPGECVLVAQYAIDHTVANDSSLNLNGADFEYYVHDQGDVNNPYVPNMKQLHHKYGIDFLYSVMNDAIVLLKVADPFVYGYDQHNCILFPKSAVLDGVEYRDNLSETEYKRLDPSIDAGLTGGFEKYSGKSVQRKINYYRNGRAVLMDNNNSSIDFQTINTPTPGYFFDEMD